MSKLDTACRKCRRANVKLFLKGEKCLSPKCPFLKRSYAPGQHGQGRQRLTEYGRQLREKQKAANIYGISAKQFINYYKKALRKREMTDLALMRLLELRLDNIVYRLGMAASRKEARVLVRDGHIMVNGKKNTYPAIQLKPKNTIEINPNSQKKTIFAERKVTLKKVKTPAWLKLNPEKYSGEMVKMPERSEIDTSIDEHIILEYFAR